MGMAASQARYLALVARKSNCEYEGQQINQARTALSNQSANLFNQMLGLSVPVPPSTQDYTKTQYSFKDGVNASTISNWEQLSTADPDYNYVVTHYYYTDQYTGSQKMLNDPQVQFNSDTVGIEQINEARVELATAEKALADAKKANEEAKKAYETSLTAYSAAQLSAATLTSYVDVQSNVTKAELNESVYEITTTTNGQSTITNYVNYSSLVEASKTTADTLITKLINKGALSNDYATDKSDIYFKKDGTGFAFLEDLEQLTEDYENIVDKTTFNGSLNTYTSQKVSTMETNLQSLETAKNNASKAYYGENGTGGTIEALETAEAAFNSALEEYNSLEHPEYIGNCELTPIGSLTEDQETEIRQIIIDMEKEGITSDITNYYDPQTGTYFGGLYSFKLNGNTYFTTYSDLEASYNSGTGINNIDGQIKLPYYNATYVSTKVEKTEKALVETDGAGRFTSIRFEDNSITYTLSMETVTDEVAYNDAMNQYYYENAKYDKMVQDINAKTSIIQHEDQQLELRLKQLETEQNALSTEMDAVQKVVKDNVEKSFKTFGG